MIKIFKIIILSFSSFLLMSSSCDVGSEGCIDPIACNYNSTATVDDGSCWFASEDCDCEDPPGSIVDCLEVCDADITNDPPDDDDDGICNDDVIGGCLDIENCKHNSNAEYNNGTCAIDLSQYYGGTNGCDCTNLDCTADDPACGGSAVMNGCENPNCIGGLLSNLEAWKIIISAKATFKSTISDSLLWIDSSTVTLGASEFALDGFNNVEQEGGSNNCSDNCYIDFFEPDPDLNILSNQIRFYFPHEEWINEIESDNFNEPNFVQDMRYYDLYALFSTGIQWDAIIAPINLTYGSLLDEISITYKFYGTIDHCKFNLSLDGSTPELLEGKYKNYSVNSNDDIDLFINISNICTDEF